MESDHNTKTFPTPVVVSLTTGVMLCEKFGSIHECFEFVLGHPIYTHEMADRNLWDYVKQLVFYQHPQLREFTAEGGSKKAAQKEVDDAVAKFGKSLSLAQGNGKRTESPIESLKRLRPDAEIILPDSP